MPVLAASPVTPIQGGGTGTSTTPTTNKLFLSDSNGNWEYVATSSLGISGGGSGTVTSVSATVPTGLSISGSPITTSGTLGLTYTVGYGLPLLASTTNWNNFLNTPSTVITAGTNLSWSGNTLNASGSGGTGTVGTSTIPTIGRLSYWTSNGTPSLLGDVATSSLGAGTGLTFSGTAGSQVGGTSGTYSVNTSQNIATLSNLTSNGFVKTISGNGTLQIDTNTYLTGNQTISLTGDISGSGATAITTTLATVNTNTGSFGGANSIPSFTVNGKGLITAATGNTPSIPASEITSGTFGTGNYTFPSQLTVTASTTLQDFTARYSTTTQATTTNFAITSLGTSAGTFLAVNANGTVIATTTPSGGSGSGTVGSGLLSQIPYYAANGTTLTATSTLVINASSTVTINSLPPPSTSQAVLNLGVRPISNGNSSGNYIGLNYDGAANAINIQGPNTNNFIIGANGSGNGMYMNFGESNSVTGRGSAVIGDNSSNFDNGQFVFGNNDSAASNGVVIGNQASGGSYPSGTTLIGAKSGAPTAFQIGGTEVGRFDATANNFGVGTSSPAAKLSIQGTGELFAVATSTGHAVAGIDSDGHPYTSGPAGAITSCGTGTGTLVGDDASGVITTATAATACTLTFSKAWKVAPVCTVTDNSLVGFADISSVSTSAVTFGISSALTGGNLYYQCNYHN